MKYAALNSLRHVESLLIYRFFATGLFKRASHAFSWYSHHSYKIGIGLGSTEQTIKKHKFCLSRPENSFAYNLFSRYIAAEHNDILGPDCKVPPSQMISDDYSYDYSD